MARIGVGTVTRDFIPDGESPPGKAAALGVRRDFVPDENTQVGRTRSQEESRRVAADAADVSVVRETARLEDEAVKKLDQMNVNESINYIRVQTPAIRDTYLKAEAENRNRATILKAFGNRDEEV